MDELAQFGVVINPPTAGAQQSVRDLQSVGRAADDTAGRVNKSTGAFDKHTNALTKNAGGLQVLLRAIAPLGGHVAEMAAQVERATIAAERMADMHEKTGTSLLKTVGIIGGAIGVLAALAIGIEAVRKAWDFLKESVIAAGEQQKEAFSFQFLIGNANLAISKLNELKAFWQSSGVFQFGDLTKAATSLTLVGIGTNNLVERIKEMGAVAIGTQGTIEGVVRAYEMLRKAATENTAPPIRGGGSVEMLGLMKALSAETHLTGDALQKAFTEGRIDIDLVNKALKDATSNGGLFAGSIEAYRKTWAGSITALSTAWEAFKEKVGAPIIDALTPILERWTTRLPELGASGDSMGEGIASWITKMDAAIKEHNFGDVFAKSIATGLTNSYSLILKVFDRIFDEQKEKMTQMEYAAWDALVEYARTHVLPWLRAEDLIKTFRGHGAGSDFSPDLPSDKVKPNAIDTLSSPGTEDAIIKHKQLFESDAAIMEKFTALQTSLNSAVADGSITQIEYNYRLQQLQETTTKALGDPAAYAKALGDFRTYEEARLRAAQDADRRLASGEASTMEAISTGLRKTMHDWGTWDQMVAKSAGDVANAISNDIGSALDSIIDGTKSLGQAFSDMAVGILRDIAKIIERMLIQYAIQQLLGGISGGGASTTGLSDVTMAGGYATGGLISGGSGVRDDVPAILTGGEYVFSTTAVNNAGGPGAMDRWHEAAKAGRVTGFGSGGRTRRNSSSVTYGGYEGFDPDPMPTPIPGNTGGGTPYVPYYAVPVPMPPGFTNPHGSNIPPNEDVAPNSIDSIGGPSLWEIINGQLTRIGNPPGGIEASGGDPYPYTGLVPSHLGDNSPPYQSPPYIPTINTSTEFDPSAALALGAAGAAGTIAGLQPTYNPSPNAIAGASIANWASVGTGVTNPSLAAVNWNEDLSIFAQLANLAGGGGGGVNFGSFGHPPGFMLRNKGGLIPSFATGGTMPHDGLAQLHKGEKISTPQQWENIRSNAGGNQTNVNTAQVSLVINNNGDGGTEAQAKGTGNQDAWKSLLKNSIIPTIQKEIVRQQRTGGIVQRKN